MKTLQEYRRARGETQIAFAERAKISQTTVSDAERGSWRLTLRAVRKIVDATGGEVTAQSIYDTAVNANRSPAA